jgi:hypothetical protein
MSAAMLGASGDQNKTITVLGVQPVDSPHNAVKSGNRGTGEEITIPLLISQFHFLTYREKDYLADGRSPTPQPVCQAYLIHFIYFFYAYVSEVVRKLSVCRGKLGHCQKNSWRNPAAKRPFAFMQLAEFIGEKRFRPVVLNKDLQFGACVDAPRIGAENVLFEA